MTTTNSLIESVKLAGDFGIFGGVPYALTGQTDTNAEIRNQSKALTAFTLKNFGVRVLANANSLETLISRNNNANGNQSVSCTANTAGWFTDSTHTDSVLSGSVYNAKRTTNGGQGNTVIAATVSNTSPLVAQRSSSNTVGLGWNTAVTYAFIFGSLNSSNVVSEANLQTLLREPATWQGLTFDVNSSPSGTCTNKSRKNTADGNQVVSVPASTAGGTLIQDSTHTDSVVTGDLVNVSCISTTTSGSILWWSSEFAGTTSAHITGTVTSGLPNLGQSFSASTTYFEALSGSLDTTTTEVNAKTNVPYALTFKNLRSSILSNTNTLTIQSRKNGADGNQAISVTSGSLRWVEDSTHSDSVSALDDLNTTIVTGGSGTIAMLSLAGTLDDGSVSASVPYTLTAAQGTYTLTGKAALFPVGRRVTSAQGTYTLTGKAAILTSARTMPAVKGTYVLTGEAAGFIHGPTVTADQGSYSLSGQAVGFVRHLSMTAVRGLYTLLGEDVSHIADASVVAGTGFYHLLGEDVLGGRAIILKARRGRYRVHKQKTVLRGPTSTRTIWPVDGGDYVLDGQDVIFGQEKFRLTFSAFNNTDLLDWSSLGGSDYLSYLHTMYVMSQDVMTWTQTPYLYVFVEDTQDASLFLSLVRDWAETGSTAEFGKELQVYKYQDGFLISVSKNRFRGKGRVYQLQFRSETGKDFNLRGWATWQGKNKEP